MTVPCQQINNQLQCSPLKKGATMDGGCHNMNVELHRLGSFADWPKDCHARPIPLAKAGFYRSGDRGTEQVTCFSCGVCVAEWRHGETPMDIHRDRSPRCSLFTGDDQNVPIPCNMTFEDIKSAEFCKNQPGGGNSDDVQHGSSNQGNMVSLLEPLPSLQNVSATRQHLSSTETSQTIIQTHSPAWSLPPRPSTLNQRPNSSSEPATQNERPEQQIMRTVIQRVPSTHKTSCFAPQKNSTDPRKTALFSFMDRMRSELERRRTFYDWPEGAWQNPETLAAAGFFYTGSADRCQCAFCRGVLRNWEPNDVPMEEHLKHFEYCPFVQGRNVGNIPSIIPGSHHHSSAALSAGPMQSALSTLATQLQNNPTSNTGKHGPSVTYRVEPQEIKARLDTATVRAVIDMGHSRDIVRQVIEHRLRTTGDDYPNAKSLVEDILAWTGSETTVHQGNASNSTTASDPEMGGAESSHGNTEKGAEENHESHPQGAETRTGKSKKKKKTKRKATTQQEAAKGEPEKLKDPANKSAQSHRGLLSAEHKKLLQENEEMKEQRVCKICLDRNVNIVFLPCAHLVSCTTCAPALKKCPICRQVIKGTVNIFMS